MTGWWAWATIAFAGSSSATVDVLVGARGDPEATLEQPRSAPDAPLEPSATTAILGEARRSWERGPWVGVSGEAWTYLPEPDPTLFRLTPRIGWSSAVGEHGHVDLAARYAFEAVPLRPSLDSGRAEATLACGPTFGDHGLDLVATGVDRRWFGTSQWSFRTAEGGLQWRWQPSDWRFGARATGQANAGFTIGPDGTTEPATGRQLRLGATVGYTHGAFDVSAEYRLYVAGEGQVEDAVRPQFTPIGEYDDDADALSAGGFVQHRLSGALGGTFGPWRLTADALGRLRVNEAGQPSAALVRSGHLAVDLGRRLGERGPQLHATVGVNAFQTPVGTGAFDPYGWVGVRWSIPR